MTLIKHLHFNNAKHFNMQRGAWDPQRSVVQWGAWDPRRSVVQWGLWGVV